MAGILDAQGPDAKDIRGRLYSLWADNIKWCKADL